MNNFKSFVTAVLLVICVVSALTLVGCRKRNELEIKVKWDRSKPEIKTGTIIKYSSLDIGKVAEIMQGPESGTTVRVRILHKYSYYIRENTVFILRKVSATGESFIEAIAIDRDAQPVLSGAVLRGVESDTEIIARKLITNWKQTGIWLAVGIVLIFLLAMSIKILFRLGALIISLAAGAITAVSFAPQIQQILQPYLPQDIRVDLVSYVIAFLIGSFICSIVVGIIFFRRYAK